MPECKISVLEILEKSRGYNTAFLTTFNLKLIFFEKAILSRLLKNSIKKVSVFVDSKEARQVGQWNTEYVDGTEICCQPCSHERLLSSQNDIAVR